MLYPKEKPKTTIEKSAPNVIEVLWKKEDIVALNVIMIYAMNVGETSDMSD